MNWLTPAHLKLGKAIADRENFVADADQATAFRRLGSPVVAFIIGACDVGEAILEDGSRVKITWGRNLDRKQQLWYLSNTSLRPVRCGCDDGSAELIIPDGTDIPIMTTAI